MLGRTALLCLGLMYGASAPANTILVNDAGDAGPGNCASTCTLRDAITTATAGDTVQFQSGLTSPITLIQGELLIDKALTIQGPGAAKLAVSAGNNSRVFDIAADVTITNLGIVDGALIGADDTMSDGGQGGSAAAGCVLVAASAVAVLDHVVVRHCVATAGKGGDGSPGTPGGFPFGGAGGAGGHGGDVIGAAIASNGSLSLLYSSVLDAHATGGNGGNGGNGGAGGGPGSQTGFGGQGGVGGAALGGAVAVSNGGSLLIFNSTIAESSGTGGEGGQAGQGTSAYPGGSGGYATGGLLYVDGGVTVADLEFSTLVNGSVTGGSGTPTGVPVANAINAASTLNVVSSIVVGASGSTTLCYSSSDPSSITPAPGSVNLDEDGSCGFSLNAAFGQVLKPLDTSATPAYLPIWQSPAIDAAANCTDLGLQTVTIDQHGTARPQGSACDLGAVEADYIFVDGFGE
jgi:hypothetical protein